MALFLLAAYAVSGHAQDLVLSKTTASTFVQGGTASYTITVANVGAGPTTAAYRVQDTMPTGLSAGTPSGSNWNCTASSTAIVDCTNSTVLAAGGTSVLTVPVNIAANAPAVIVNTAVVSGGGDVVTNNNSASAVTNVSPIAPDLTLAKAAGGTFQFGASASYVITVSNSGNTATTAPFSVLDVMPTGLTAGTPTGTNWNCAASTTTTVDCTNSTALAAGGTSVLTIPVAIAANAPASITNTATVSGGGESVTNNNAGSVTVAVTAIAPDLTLAKTTSSTFLQRGTASYSLTVTNSGNTFTSASYRILDVMPTGLTAGVPSGNGWVCTASTATVVDCTRSIGLAAGATTLLVVPVNISANAPASITNTATVSGGGENVTNNNTASITVSVTPVAADLRVSKSAVGRFFQGGTASYTLSISNQGNGATNAPFRIVDTMPTGLTAGTPTGTNWNCAASTATVVDCTSSSVLAAGAFSTLTLPVTIAADAPVSITNTATVSGGGELVTNNNTGSTTVAVSPAGPELTITMTSNSSFAQGGVALYKVTIGNNGNTATTSPFRIFDTMPVGLSAGVPSGTDWDCSASTPSVSDCTNATALAPGANSLLTIPVNIALGAPASITNTATVSGGGDVNTSNNSSSVTKAVTTPKSDVIPVVVAPGVVVQGGQATYTVTVKNVGAASTSGTYFLFNPLPTGLTMSVVNAGLGWDCFSSTSTVINCSRSTVLAAGISAPVVSVIVNVSPSANAFVAFNVTANGGSESNTDNAINPVTMQVVAQPVLQSVASRKLHNGVPYDIPVDASQLVNGPVSVEPRSNTSGHTLVFTFNNPILSVDSIPMVTSTGSLNGVTASSTVQGGNVLVTLNNVPDARRVTVTVTGLNGGAIASTSVGFLVGDVNSSRRVDAADVADIKAHAGELVDGSNFRYDISRSGRVGASDIAGAKVRAGGPL